MNWFRENRFLGTFVIVVGVCTLGALFFVWTESGASEEAAQRFGNTSTELRRLERLAPYPNEDNLRKMKAHTENYSTALAKLREELKLRMPPIGRLAPNEFQSRLRVAMNAVADKARANKVKLPDKFYLGFDEFASALPSEAAAPLLGQELVQVEWLLNSMLDAHVDAVTAFRRNPAAHDRGVNALPTATPAKPGGNAETAAKLIDRNVVEATFSSSPSVAGRVLNQIAAANQEFCIIRLLHVKNEKGKGPPREVAAESAAAVATPPATVAGLGAKPSPAAALNFIIGNEKIETTTRIEIVRFTF
ncbi:MAG: Amuc_1100 family pilus-like protein [Chthoniobacterales bacterium]